MPNHPKPPGQRRRRNKVATAATAERQTVKPPSVTGWRDLHTETRRWWMNVKNSEHASQYTAADWDGLLRLLRLVEAFNAGDVGLASEIRLQEERFGLSPVARNRLSWTVTPPEKRAAETSVAERRKDLKIG